MATGRVVPGALRSAVVKANADLARGGLALFNLGHASAIDREHGRVIARPNDRPLDRLKPRDLVVTDLEGDMVDGTLDPPTDLATHLEIYRAFPSIGAVIHVHSHFATVWAQAGREIRCMGTTHADHFNGPIPVTRPLRPAEIGQDYDRNIGRVIVERFDGEPTTMFAVLVNSQTSYVWGKTISAAVETASILEEVARLAFHTAVLGPTADHFPRELLWMHFRRAHPRRDSRS
jgi:L-ribulose-5-phosphate 4-epimerase